MTAFDNIKTNNWPATSNDFEDFLILKMPLNDSASLTESLPVVAGSKVLFPKSTLTNSGAFANTDVGAKWDASTTGAPYNGSWDVVFDGNATATTSTQGPSYWHYTYESTTSVTLKQAISGQIEILAGRPGSNDSGTHSITLQSGGSDVHTVTLGTNGASGYQWFDFGTRSNIDKFVITGGDPGVAIWAVRVDNVLLVNPTGGPKKHYDNNAYFDSNAYLQLAAADSVFNLGVDDFCIEYYFKADNLSSAYKLFQLGTEINWTENIEMQMNTNGTIDYDIYPGGSVAQSNYGFTGTQTFTAGTWNHVAFTRQGSTFRGFLNGVADGSATYAGIISSPTLAHNRPSFGCRTNGSVTSIQGPRLVGSIQDFRLYRGTAKYTANFTPPGAILG